MPKIRTGLIFAPLLLLCCCHHEAPTRAHAPAPNLSPESVRLSLTAQGSKAFHLTAQIVEATNLENDSYKATIDEYWLSANEWRRTVKTQNFSQIIVVSGEARREYVTGDYYPNWLRTMVTAIFEPGEPLRNIDFTANSDNPSLGSGPLCRRFDSVVGIPPAQNRVFSTVCFDGSQLQSVDLPGYDATYRSFQSFDGKRAPRLIREYLEPGTELQATVNLTDLRVPDRSLFALPDSAESSMGAIALTENELRKHANDPLQFNWPSVPGGKTEGVLSVFVCLDRMGKVRETYPLNSDNPEMAYFVRSRLREIQFGAPTLNGQSVQAEGVLTFSFKTIIQGTYPVLSDEEARERIISFDPPALPPGIPSGTVISVTVQVDETGRTVGNGPFIGIPEKLGSVAPDAGSWTFKPLLKDGKPTPFQAVLKFVVP